MQLLGKHRRSGQRRTFLFSNGKTLSIEMEPENKLKIQANQKEIVATIAVADVEDHLIQFGLLSEEESEFIKVRGITRQEGIIYI